MMEQLRSSLAEVLHTRQGYSEDASTMSYDLMDVR